MDTSSYLVKPDTIVDLSQWPTSEKDRISDEELLEKRIPERVKRLQELHLRLRAEEKTGILVALQALDAGGKDEAISYIFSNLPAQGLRTSKFRKPTETDLLHDYLWRLHDGLPARGEIAILNRSHYEEVISIRVHNQLENQPIPGHLIGEDIWKTRYRQINEFERYLTENGFPVVKFFFHLSKEEQRKRLLDRMKDPTRNWEFSFSDVEDRDQWKEHQEVFEDMLNHTSTDYAPWYVLPADDEDYARYIITEVMIELLEKIDPQFPEISGEDRKKLEEYIKKLENDSE